MHIANYLGLLHQSEKDLAKAFRMVADHHGDEVDIFQTCILLATWSDKHIEELTPIVAKYAEEKNKEPDRLKKAIFDKPRSGPLALLRDLHDVYLLATEVSLCYTVLSQAAAGLKDKDLTASCEKLSAETRRQLSWLMTRIRESAPQTLIVAE
jgi:hypothetical protein